MFLACEDFKGTVDQKKRDLCSLEAFYSDLHQTSIFLTAALIISYKHLIYFGLFSVLLLSQK